VTPPDTAGSAGLEVAVAAAIEELDALSAALELVGHAATAAGIRRDVITPLDAALSRAGKSS
jgi:hypothetical protein